MGPLALLGERLHETRRPRCAHAPGDALRAVATMGRTLKRLASRRGVGVAGGRGRAGARAPALAVSKLFIVDPVDSFVYLLRVVRHLARDAQTPARRGPCEPAAARSRLQSPHALLANDVRCVLHGPWPDGERKHPGLGGRGDDGQEDWHDGQRLLLPLPLPLLFLARGGPT